MAFAGLIIAGVAAAASVASVVVAATAEGPKAPELPALPPVPLPPAPSVVPVDNGLQEIQDIGAANRDLTRRRLSATSKKSPVSLIEKAVKQKTLLGN